jgi:hypothetical protein
VEELTLSDKSLTPIHLLVLLVLLVTGCASAPREPRVNQAQDVLLLNIDIAEGALEHRANISKGKTSGALHGTGAGLLYCIGAGLEADSASGNTGAGFLLGVLASPICGAVGGIIGASEADDQEVVLENTHKLRSLLESQSTPATIAQGIKEQLPRQSLSSIVLDDTSGRSSNLDLIVRIEHVSLVGAGINPTLPLTADGTICVRDRSSNTDLIFQKFRVQSGSYRLDEWANGGDYLLKYQTERLLSSLVNSIDMTIHKHYRTGKAAPCKPVRTAT